jgi:regulator of protease activity HflC (stomatin/prohibitin superfamily)
MKREEAVKIFEISLVFLGILSVISAVVLFLLGMFFWGILASVFVGGIFYLKYNPESPTIIIVSNNHIAIVEFMGAEVVELPAGWHTFINVLGVDRFIIDFDLAEQSIDLDLSENGLGDVDIADDSIGVSAKIFYKVSCPFKTFKVARNYKNFTASMFEAVIRKYLGKYTADEVIEQKKRFNIDSICGEDDDLIGDLSGYGIVPVSVSILDIRLSEEVKKARQASLKMQASLEASKIETKKIEEEAVQVEKKAEGQAKAKKIIAEAEAHARRIQGAADAEAVKKTVEVFKDVDKTVINHFTTVEKFKNLKDGAVVIVNDGNNSDTDFIGKVIAADKILNKNKGGDK